MKFLCLGYQYPTEMVVGKIARSYRFALLLPPSFLSGYKGTHKTEKEIDL